MTFSAYQKHCWVIAKKDSSLIAAGASYQEKMEHGVITISDLFGENSEDRITSFMPKLNGDVHKKPWSRNYSKAFCFEMPKIFIFTTR